MLPCVRVNELMSAKHVHAFPGDEGSFIDQIYVVPWHQNKIRHQKAARNVVLYQRLKSTSVLVHVTLPCNLNPQCETIPMAISTF